MGGKHCQCTAPTEQNRRPATLLGLRMTCISLIWTVKVGNFQGKRISQIEVLLILFPIIISHLMVCVTFSVAHIFTCSAETFLLITLWWIFWWYFSFVETFVFWIDGLVFDISDNISSDISQGIITNLARIFVLRLYRKMNFNYWLEQSWATVLYKNGLQAWTTVTLVEFVPKVFPQNRKYTWPLLMEEPIFLFSECCNSTSYFWLSLLTLPPMSANSLKRIKSSWHWSITSR